MSPVSLYKTKESFAYILLGGIASNMGVHHFSLSILPRAYFERNGSPVPLVLTEEDIDRSPAIRSGDCASAMPLPYR
jgi:hypothetical protein